MSKLEQETMQAEIDHLRRMLDAAIRREARAESTLGRVVAIVEAMEQRLAALEGDAV